MSNVFEYILSLKDLISPKLQKIIISNNDLLDRYAKIEQQNQKVEQSFKHLGTSVTTLKQKIDLLKSERDLLPVGSLSAIRKYNSEIHKLERNVSKLETLNGSKIKTWFQDALNGLPGIATNPLVLLGGTIAKSVQIGMEADMQKANLMTLLKGDAEGVKALYAKISDYGVKTPCDKAGLIEAQKTMISFGLNADFAFEKLQNIGDIALGDAGKMQSLALAFSQASSAGKLQGQDLLQMINAGFNPLQVISEKTGESMVSLKKRMSDGQISAQALAKSFEWATEKGGIFYQGAEKAGATLGGRFSKMMDSLSELALKLYDVISPIIAPIIDLVTSLFESLGSGLGWLVQKFQEGNPYILAAAGVIGAFTSALILHNTYTALASVFQNGLTLAVWKTNLAFLANPVTLVIAGIIALIGILVLCWNKFEGFRGAVMGVWEVLKGLGTMIKNYVIHRFNELLAGIKGVGSAIVSFLSGDFEGAIQKAAKAGKDIIGANSGKQALEDGKKAFQSFNAGWEKGVKMKPISIDNIMKTNQKATNAATAGRGKSDIFSSLLNGGKDDEKRKKKKKNPAKDKANSITAGGSKQTHIVVNIGKLQDQTLIQVSNTEQGLNGLGEKVQEMLLRAVNSLNQMQTT